jgi:Fe2+ or Zn2+ uptake regulation protein
MQNNFSKEIKAKGLKITKARLAIFEILVKIKHPETVQNIYKKLKNIDLVTLYRTIGSFEKNGLLRRVDLHKDSVYYEINTNHHHHIICKKCGAMEDFNICDINRLTKKITAKASQFKIINEHNFELFGMCNDCVKS